MWLYKVSILELEIGERTIECFFDGCVVCIASHTIMLKVALLDLGSIRLAQQLGNLNESVRNYLCYKCDKPTISKPSKTLGKCKNGYIYVNMHLR